MGKFMSSKPECFYHDERHVHDIEPKTLLDILLTSAWKTLNQEITSAETNNDNNAEPSDEKSLIGENCGGVNAFADLTFKAGVKKILDVGGGKFDVCQNYMQRKDIRLVVFDPYNRSEKHNASVKKSIAHKKVGAATLMNPLIYLDLKFQSKTLH